MGHLSVKIPDYLHQQLELKAQQMGGLNMSDVVRILLSSAIEYPHQTETNHKLQNKILKHVVTLYYLLKEQIEDSGENGLKLNNLAHEKAEKAIEKILEP